MNLLDLLIQAGPLGQKTLKLIQLYPGLRVIIEAHTPVGGTQEILTLREILENILKNPPLYVMPAIQRDLTRALDDQ